MDTQSIVSVGNACSLLQIMPDQLRAAAVGLGIEPAIRINGVDHYAEDDLGRIAEDMRLRRAI